MPGRSRYLVFLAVAGAHSLALAVFLGRSATVLLSSSTVPPLAAFLLLRPVRPRAPVARPRLNASFAPAVPVVEPITVAPPAPFAASPRAIDWSSAAKRAAATVLQRGKRISFGFPPGGKSAITLGVPSRHTPAHYAGESDRTVAGEHVEWTSERCYVTSDPPVPGAPDFLEHARVSRGGCLPPAGPDPGDLFKSLPAYKKHHPK